MAEAVRYPFIFTLVTAPLHDLRSAGAGVGDLDQHLAGLERRDFDLRQDQRRARLDEESGFGFHRCDLKTKRERFYRQSGEHSAQASRGRIPVHRIS